MSTQLATPAALTALLDRLVMDPERRLSLNKRMANRARQYFRGQINRQCDIDNTPYPSRTRRRHALPRDGKGSSGKGNRKMLVGFAKAMRVQADADSFAVGMAGQAAKIGRVHNEGKSVPFTHRLEGFYDRRTGQWEGGRKVTSSYPMPQRTFLGWTPKLERELIAMVAEEMAFTE